MELSKFVKDWGAENRQEKTTCHPEMDRKTTTAPSLVQGSCCGAEQRGVLVNCSQLGKLLSDPLKTIVTVDNAGEGMGRVRGG